MNGTVIDIPGIHASVIPIEMQDSTDMAHIISIRDGKIEVLIEINYGKIISICQKGT